MGKKTYVVGICNNNAPGLYRKYNCYDHLFHYDIADTDIDQGAMKIALALEAFNTLVTHRLGIELSNHLVDAEQVEEYQRITKPEKVLQQILVLNPLSQELKIELNEDDKQLYLCRNYIVELNENISKLTQVTVFQTCCNYLRYLPCGIGCLKNLKMLILSRNRLTVLPDEIGFCKELREVDVSYNLLSFLPQSIVALKKLNTLHITGNNFKTIPSFIGKLYSLKYFGIGRNPIVSVPLEVFKLPFLLSISFESCKMNIKMKFAEAGRFTLQEIAARNIIKNNLPVPRHMPINTREYILRVQECAFCGGPYFDNHIEVEDYHIFESTRFPINYKMCSKHYFSHEERLPALFARNIDTVPVRLQKEHMPSVSELFESFSFNELQIKKMNEGIAGKSKLMPLISLAKYNSSIFKRFKIDMFLDETVENLNPFDQGL